MAVTKQQTQDVVKKFGTNEKDTGRTEVQIALLTQRIENLTAHFKNFPKDHSSRRGLLKLVGQRRRLLKYLKREQLETYRNLIATLNLRK
jgi:small subunit ribosomal protein S15